MGVDDAKDLGRFQARLLERLRIALVRRRTDESKKKRAQRGPECRVAPVHPPIRLCPVAEILRPQTSRGMLRCQVSNNNVRFPKYEPIILDRRHETVGIEVEVTG